VSIAQLERELSLADHVIGFIDSMPSKVQGKEIVGAGGEEILSRDKTVAYVPVTCPSRGHPNRPNNKIYFSFHATSNMGRT
jgi:hypothetical protein